MIREMIWPQLQSIADIAISRVLNSLPEGLLIAAFAWVLLRILPRQNSGTRFAVWFIALLSIAGLPFIRSVESAPAFAPRLAHAFVVPDSLGLFLFALWILAASAAILRLVIGLWHLRSLRRSCVIVDAAALHPAVQETVAEFSSIRPVALATSDQVAVPAAIGFFKPLIVLPTWSLRELPTEELNVILLHEFAHLRRWDDWTNLLQKTLRAVFLFHPAIWWIDNRLSLEREMACDDVVLATTENPRGYAQCLISLLEKNMARRGWAMAQALVHRAHEVSLRLTRILDSTRPQSKNVWKPAVGLLSAFCAVSLVAMLRAPQFVAFDRQSHAQAVAADEPTALPSNHFQLSGASIIPAALHVAPAALPRGRSVHHKYVRKLNRLTSKVAANLPTQSLPFAQQNSAAVRPVNITTVADRSEARATETIFLIQTTERVGRNAWISSVYVWRVDWVEPSQLNPNSNLNRKVPAQNPAGIAPVTAPVIKKT
jgi:beta-lactamase regulating signal transducer with metallopeptidase domain